LYNIVSHTFLVFIFIIAVVFLSLKKISFLFFIFLIFLLTLSALFIRRIWISIFSNLQSFSEESGEEINILKENINKNTEILQSLPGRERQMQALVEVSKRLIELTETDDVYDRLIDIVRELFPSADDILLFVRNKHLLKLVRSDKSKINVIKEKNGDFLDKWVVRHSASLLIDDITEDFRFDSGKVVAYKDRNMRAFVVSPLSIGDRVIGVLRIENKKVKAFDMADNRVLRSICDLGAIVMDKAHYFDKTRELAIRDSLTNISLRDYFFERLREEMSRSRLKKTQLGLLMMDVDNFKQINDSYGHVVGDVVLKRIANILLEVVGETANVVCRYGGEEFILFVVNCNKEDLSNIAEIIRRRVEESPIHFRRKTINFSVSIGGLMFPKDALDEKECVRKLDELMYKAKKEGKNRVCLP